MDREISPGEQLTTSYRQFMRAYQEPIVIDDPDLGVDKSHTLGRRIVERQLRDDERWFRESLYGQPSKE